MDRPWLQFDSGDILPGLETGGVAVVSDLTLGLWNGGNWRCQYGFGVSKGLGYIGLAAGATAGAIYVAPYATSIYQAFADAYGSDIAVLGRYPYNMQLARQLGASYLNVPNWTKIANFVYLLVLKFGGTQVLFSDVPDAALHYGSTFATELKWMSWLNMAGKYYYGSW